MAKIGEGDPRWLVQERSDGANVNNWHWTELDCSQWAKDRLTSIFNAVSFEENGRSFKIKVESVTGESSVNTRKGKVLFFYELEVKLKYEGYIPGEEKKFEGKIHIPYIGDENADDGEIEVKVTADGNSASDNNLKQFIQEKGKKIFQNVVAQFLADLKEEKGPKNLKPTPQVVSSATHVAPVVAEPKPQPKVTAVATTKASGPKSVSTKTITLKVKLRGPLDEVFGCLLDPNRVSMFTQSATTLSPQPGSQFSFYSGTITGQMVSVEPNKKIVQKWRMRDWPEGHYSEVTLEFDSTKDGTTLSLKQTGVPEEDVDRIKAGWDEKFWRRMKMMFGWGSLYD